MLDCDGPSLCLRFNKFDTKIRVACTPEAFGGSVRPRRIHAGRHQRCRKCVATPSVSGSSIPFSHAGLSRRFPETRVGTPKGRLPRSPPGSFSGSPSAPPLRSPSPRLRQRCSRLPRRATGQDAGRDRTGHPGPAAGRSSARHRFAAVSRRRLSRPEGAVDQLPLSFRSVRAA